VRPNKNKTRATGRRARAKSSPRYVK